jgi:hypothetical protein
LDAWCAPALGGESLLDEVFRQSDFAFWAASAARSLDLAHQQAAELQQLLHRMATTARVVASTSESMTPEKKDTLLRKYREAVHRAYRLSNALRASMAMTAEDTLKHEDLVALGIRIQVAQRMSGY